MSTKLKSLNIKGIRGTKDVLNLTLNGKSILLYGDNGTGKSSIADAIEWIYFDGIEHLSNEEIGRKKGKDALRNLFLKATEDAYAEIEYTDSKLNCKKSINAALSSSYSNSSRDYQVYLSGSQGENLVLRYKDLILFIIASKKEKLDKLQEIIGFSEVGKVRDLLKRNAGRIKRNIAAEGFDNKKSALQTVILENLGTNAHTQEQFFQTINKLIESLGLNTTMSSFSDIKKVLGQIENKDDLKIADEISLQTKVHESVKELEGNADKINKEYKKYYDAVTKLRTAPDKLSKLQMLDLLREGANVLQEEVIKDNYCPLCLQEKNKLQLIRELKKRIEELETLEEEKDSIEELNEELRDSLESDLSTLSALLKEKKFKEKEYSALLIQIKSFKIDLEKIITELDKELLSKESLSAPGQVTIDKKKVKEVSDNAKNNAKRLTDEQKKNTKLVIYSKLRESSKAYFNYLQLEKRHAILIKQQVTFENLFTDFIKRQEEALTAFLQTFSTEINDFYTSMNPREKVDNIKLVPLKDKTTGDLVGITIEYSFFSALKIQPIAYLSESHINCLGLSFFLASVKAFNKQNEFFILDDVISSFDRNHRARFAKLLVDKFNSYQILLLTHERDFFELVASDVKGKGWNIHQIEWSPDHGTSMETTTTNGEEKIRQKLHEKNIDGIGNDIRIYAEKTLKEVALNIEAPVPFRYNQVNEKRMVSELLDSIQKRISDKSKELKTKVDISKIKGIPVFVGNTSSHDNDYQASISDYEVMWEDFDKLIHLFYCKDCKKFISMKYIDPVKNRIRCACQDEKLNYDWK